MNPRQWALACCFLTAMAHFSISEAGVWGTDPVLGVLGDYSTDPGLLHQRDTALATGALQLDAPTTYQDGSFKFGVLPSFRVNNDGGYSGVTSDYEHLNVKGELDGDRSVLSAGAGVARDSSLGYDYLSSGSIGVRRDSESADLNWDEHLTERFEFDADAHSQRVRFGQSLGATLTDYDYSSITPTLSWNSGERSKVSFAGTVSRYDSLIANPSTESRSANLQLGIQGQLSELWNLTATGGYSRALDQTETKIGCEPINVCVLLTEFGPCLSIQSALDECLFDDKIRSGQDSSVYAINIVRQGSRLVLSAIASLPSSGLVSARQITRLAGSFATASWSRALRTDASSLPPTKRVVTVSICRPMSPIALLPQV